MGTDQLKYMMPAPWDGYLGRAMQGRGEEKEEAGAGLPLDNPLSTNGGFSQPLGPTRGEHPRGPLSSQVHSPRRGLSASTTQDPLVNGQRPLCSLFSAVTHGWVPLLSTSIPDAHDGLVQGHPAQSS